MIFVMTPSAPKTPKICMEEKESAWASYNVSHFSALICHPDLRPCDAGAKFMRLGRYHWRPLKALLLFIVDWGQYKILSYCYITINGMFWVKWSWYVWILGDDWPHWKLCMFFFSKFLFVAEQGAWKRAKLTFSPTRVRSQACKFEPGLHLAHKNVTFVTTSQ